jgi:hypothetical protein
MPLITAFAKSYSFYSRTLPYREHLNMLSTETELVNYTGFESPSIASPFQPTDPLQSLALSGSSSAIPRTIAFVDSRVGDAITIMANLQSDVKVLLDPTRDGIVQITETLGHYKDLTGIDIISHGNVAELQLGNSSLSADSLQQYTSELQQWKVSLAPGADLLFFGCNVATGEVGRAFVQDLSNLTGSDVAASTNLTGSSARGGDWRICNR